MGNALVGNYLTLLNFSQKAIMFATVASPNSILWLSRANKSLADIEFEDFNLASASNSAKPVPITAPPIQTVRTPPAVTYTPPAAQYSSNGQWSYYATSANGSTYYYDKSSLRQSGATTTIWTMADHSKNTKIAHRSSKEMWEYSCANQSAKLKMYVDYDANGSVAASHTFNAYENSFEPLVPDSIAMALWSEVCQR